MWFCHSFCVWVKVNLWCPIVPSLAWFIIHMRVRGGILCCDCLNVCLVHHSLCFQSLLLFLSMRSFLYIEKARIIWEHKMTKCATYIVLSLWLRKQWFSGFICMVALAYSSIYVLRCAADVSHTCLWCVDIIKMPYIPRNDDENIKATKK